MNTLNILSQSLRPAAELEAELAAELRAARTERERVRVSFLPDGQVQMLLVPREYTQSFLLPREPRKPLRGRALKRWLRAPVEEPLPYAESDGAVCYPTIRAALEAIYCEAA